MDRIGQALFNLRRRRDWPGLSVFFFSIFFLLTENPEMKKHLKKEMKNT